jgi:hypothetical protein
VTSSSVASAPSRSQFVVRRRAGPAASSPVIAQLFVRRAAHLVAALITEEIYARFGNRPAPSTPAEAYCYERDVHRLCAGVADVFVHSAFEAAHQRCAFVDQIVGATLSASHMYREGDRDVSITYLGGTTMTLRTPYVLNRRRGAVVAKRTKRGKEGRGAYPVLRQLGVLARTSPGLVSEVGIRVASVSIDEAHADLARRGIGLDKKSVRLVALKLGDQGIKARDRLLDEARTSPPRSGLARGLRLVVSTDGGKSKIRYGGNRGRRNARTHRRKYQTKWVEPRVLAIHAIDERGKKDRYEVGVLDAAIVGADAVFEMLVGYLKLLGAHEAAEIVIVADGALWIWGRVGDLIRQVGLERVRITQVIDFYHATERLGTISKMRATWPANERERWLKRIIRQLWKGQVATVLDECRLLCRGCRSKEIKDLLDYFDRNRERMDYKRFRELGLPMGSGVIESAVRRVVNLRVKGPGIIWHQQNANKVLHMRAQLKLGQWDAFVARALDELAPKSASTLISSGVRAAM